jgi:hypothetical protein
MMDLFLSWLGERVSRPFLFLPLSEGQGLWAAVKGLRPKELPT